MKKNFSLLYLYLFLGVGLTGCFDSAPPPPAELVYDSMRIPQHTVKKGETIASIARRYNMEKGQLIRMNQLSAPYRVVPGQKIWVKGVESGSSRHKGKTSPEESPEVEEEEGSWAPGSKGGNANQSSGQPFSSPSLGGTSSEAVDQDVEVRPLPADDAPPSEEKSHEGEESAPFQPPESSSAGKAESSSVKASSGQFSWPVKGQILKKFHSSDPAGGEKGQEKSQGINIAAPRRAPVKAAAEGKVRHAGNQIKGLGNMIVVEHPDKMLTIYAHLEEMLVKKGDTVSSGQKIATVGNTGSVRATQLYFQVRKDGIPVDPLTVLP